MCSHMGIQTESLHSSPQKYQGQHTSTMLIALDLTCCLLCEWKLSVAKLAGPTKGLTVFTTTCMIYVWVSGWHVVMCIESYK